MPNGAAHAGQTIRLIRLSLFTLLAWVVPAAAQVRAPACVQVHEEVRKWRLGKDRQERPHAVDVPRAVAIGRAAADRCRGDDGFLLAYSLARIDLSADPRRGAPEERAAQFRAAVTDLEEVRTAVLGGRSQRYEIFNILGLIYFDTRRYTDSVAVTTPPAALMAKMTPKARQYTLATRAMAYALLGQSTSAAQSFDMATKSGHPGAAAIKRKMLGKK